MTQQEMIQMTMDLADEQDQSLAISRLNTAKATILSRMYPFGIPDNVTFPKEHEIRACKLASRYILRRGGEGEIMHSENGISRTYQSVNDEDILREIIPYIKVVR